MYLIVISPPGSARFASIERQLTEHSLSVDQVVGVLGENLDASWVSGHVDQRAARIHQGAELTARQIGCYVGHRQAWEAAYKSGSEWATVLEDDAIVSPHFRDTVDGLDRLFCQKPTVISFLSTGRHALRTRGTAREVAPEVVIRPLRWPPNSAVGYAMNRAAMRLRLECEALISSTADWPPWAADAQFWVTDPWIVGHSDGASLIGAAGPDAVHGFGASLTKALWLRFILAPQPYRSNPVRYWRHAYAPAAEAMISRLSAAVTEKRALRS